MEFLKKAYQQWSTGNTGPKFEAKNLNNCSSRTRATVRNLKRTKRISYYSTVGEPAGLDICVTSK